MGGRKEQPTAELVEGVELSEEEIQRASWLQSWNGCVALFTGAQPLEKVSRCNGKWHTVVPELREIVLSGLLGQALFAGELASVNIKSMSQDIDEIIAGMEYTKRGIAEVRVSKRKGHYNPIEATPTANRWLLPTGPVRDFANY